MCWTIITGKALGSAVTLFLRMVTRKQEKSQSFIWDIITPGKNNCSPSCPKTQHCENTIIYSSYWCHKIFCLYIYLCPFIVKSFIFKYFQKQEISLIILWIFWGYICECLVCWKNSTNVCETKLEDTDAPSSRPHDKAPWASGPNPPSSGSRLKLVIWELGVSQDLLSYHLLENALKFMSFLNCGIQDILFKNAYFGGSYKEFNR